MLLCLVGGGVPIPGPGGAPSKVGGTPSQGGGYPSQVLMGYPIQGLGGTPSGGNSQVPPTIKTWLGYPPEWGPLPPSTPGWDTPLGWGTPNHHQNLARVPPGMGYPPPSRPGLGTHPTPDLGWGTPPPQTCDGDTPPNHPDLDGAPPTPDLRWGTNQPSRPGRGTPVPPKCEQTDTCENRTFPRTSYFAWWYRFTLLICHKHRKLKILTRDFLEIFSNKRLHLWRLELGSFGVQSAHQLIVRIRFSMPVSWY